MVRLAAAVLALALLAGCGSGARKGAAPAPDQTRRLAALHRTAVPTGFRRHAIRQAGISVALPVGWQVLGQRDAVFPGAFQNLGRLDRSFRAPLGELASPDSPLKLFAFDRVFWRHHATTAMVVQATYGRPGRYTAWSARIRRALLRAPGRLGPLRMRPLALAPGIGLRGEYRTARGDTVVVYVVGARSGLWALVFRTPTPLAALRRAEFARAAATLELATPLGGPFRRDAPGPGA